MIVSGQNDSLLAADVRFVAGVLRDAEKLEWGGGQLERRKRAVQTIMTGRMAGTWKEESDLYGLTSVDDYEDRLFKKHGWNKVDSGFRLWGADLRLRGSRRGEQHRRRPACAPRLRRSGRRRGGIQDEAAWHLTR